ncbi:unnamed protein product [Lymnaea stagnalis]|uniref:RBR-type E3 ubiquitin transferase n=1 Tax=Lymnaea stagnalis TaxID=6523 RepID=A0AAV2HQQ0_LYMST
MAEGGILGVNYLMEQTQLAEGEDRLEQENELFALEAIFENEDIEICKHDNPNGHPPGGIFNIPIKTPDNFYVKITKDLRLIRNMTFSGRGRGWAQKRAQREAEKKKELEVNHSEPHYISSTSSIAGSEILYHIKRLPPVTLTFSYPRDYPSANQPNFTLSCCWLEKKNLTRLCEKLDDIWAKHRGTSVIAEWHDFLDHEVIAFLDIKSPYDLGRVLSHIFTHPPGQDKNDHKLLKPKPLDIRGIQTFGSIEEVLPAVLDFNLATCDVCMEEKAGNEFLRLVNCEEHKHCKSCSKGWIEAMINDGAVSDLRCPGYKCEKAILPTEVASVVSEVLYQRYDKLLLKTAFDVMTDVMNCPRSFCQFPVVLEDNLGLCPKCKHAFCGRCQNTYHGHSPCKLKSEMFALLCEEYESSTSNRKQELEMRYGKQVIQRALEETKTNKWLESNSKQCPCCSTFIQKLEGCNHMKCNMCGQSFCYLCGDLLPREKPYAHFSDEGRTCNGRLFENSETQEEEVDFRTVWPWRDLMEQVQRGMFEDADE